MGEEKRLRGLVSFDLNSWQGRRAFEAIFAAFIFLLGLVIFYAWRQESNPFLEALSGVALFLSTALSTSLIAHFISQRAHETEVRAIVAETERRILDSVVKSSHELGLDGFVDRLDYGAFLDSLSEGEELLWLDTFVHSYAAFIDRLRPALQRGVMVRMLVIDSSCTNAKHRAQEIQYMYPESEHFIAGVNGFVAEIDDLMRESPDLAKNLVLRKYADLPCAPIYIVRKGRVPIRGYSSLFLHKATDGFRHFSWTYRDNGFLPLLNDYFENKWKANASNDLLLEEANCRHLDRGSNESPPQREGD